LDASPQVDWVRSEHLNLHGFDQLGLWMAPGRVNVIGEHTDYNNGFVLPFALENAVFVAASPRSDDTVVVSSRQLGTSSFDLVDLDKATGRLSHAESAIKVAREESRDLVGLNLVVDSSIPIGSGLSSSAAFVCALILAASEVTGSYLSPETIATAARRAETEGVGVPVGAMDPMVSMCAKADHALLLDCQTLDIEHIPFRVSVGDSPSVLIIDTRTPRRLVGGEYADRRRACHDAAVALGVETLRDAGLEMLEGGRLSNEEFRRARHVISENNRVVDAVEAMRERQFDALGELLFESHRSLADDFEVSIPELDTAVDAAVDAGAYGARMTGAGFGGCAIALVPPDRTQRVEEAVTSAFRERNFEPPGFLPAKPSAGAHRID
jgi:galactokinase